MKTLDGGILTRQVSVNEDVDIDQVLIQLECVKIDLEKFSKKKENLESIIEEARKLGYRNPKEREADLDAEVKVAEYREDSSEESQKGN